MNSGNAMFLMTAVWLGTATVSAAWPQSEPDNTVRITATVENVDVTSSSMCARASRAERTEAGNYTKARLGMSLVKNMTLDQRDLWASPAKLRFSDADWLVPAGGLAAVLFVTDRDVSLHLSHNPRTISRYNTISNASVGALIGGAGGVWLVRRV